MTTSRKDPADDRDVGPLSSAVSPTPGDDGADGMAGPVNPPPETEPDAHRDGTLGGLGQLLRGGED
jgi:hypothetical protein